MAPGRVATDGAARTLTVLVGAAAGLFVLNTLFTLHNRWPTPWVRFSGELSVELAALVLAMALLTFGRALPGRRAHLTLLAIAVALAMGRYAQITFPALLGRPVNLYWDIRHFPSIAGMVADAYPASALLLGVAVIVAALGAFVFVVSRCLAAVERALSMPRPRLVVVGLALLGVGAYTAGKLSPAVGWEYRYSIPVSRMYYQEARLIVEAFMERHGIDVLPASPPMDGALGSLSGGDVYIIFNESYGATVFDNTAYHAALQPAFTSLDSAATARGMAVASAYFLSPTFAGASWLAHSSLLSGIVIDNDRDHRLLLASARPTLVDLFEKQGYRTVALKPGLKRPWPEGAYYGFDRIYDDAGLDYGGPPFGWWAIPDQYALARLVEKEIDVPGRAPVLTVFSTVATHSPFVPSPPYQSDWNRLLGEDPFDEEMARHSLERSPDLANLGPDYLRAVAYSLAWITGFVSEIMDHDDLLIVLGDHQPLAAVSGPGARWDVPVHVVSANRSIIAALAGSGFDPSLVPVSRPLGDFARLQRVLLDAMN